MGGVVILTLTHSYVFNQYVKPIDSQPLPEKKLGLLVSQTTYCAEGKFTGKSEWMCRAYDFFPYLAEKNKK